jgi:hypothetical protein
MTAITKGPHVGTEALGPCARAARGKMTTLSPHVKLVGFGYLEPLARPIVDKIGNSPTSSKPRGVPPLTQKAALITERLAAKSHWIGVRSPRSEFSFPSVTSLSTSPHSVIFPTPFDSGPVDVLTTQYSRFGTWKSPSPPMSPVPSRHRDPPSIGRRMLETPRDRRAFETTPAWHELAPPRAQVEAEAERRQHELEERARLESYKMPWRFRQPMSLAKVA